jgi:hypothetical protein
MEVNMKTARLFGVGILAAVALTFAALGCSNSSPVAPQAALSGAQVQTAVKDAPRNAQSSGFELYGDVAAFYPDKSLMVFSAKTASDRSVGPTKYSLIVSKNAKVVLLPDRETVPFDAKYTPTGTSMIVFGNYDNDGTMIVDRLEIDMILPENVSSSSSI